MSRQAYPYSTAPAARHITNHGTSSAFSSSANPDEDWTKISDLAERRRIQNRIAQRNYRKKLKRRLEDLERRAGSSSVSPPQSHAVLDTQRPNDSKPQQYKRSPETTQRQVEPRHMPNQYTPPMTSEEEFPMFPSHGYEREGSRTPPLTYHTYPAPEDINYAPYPSQAYHSDRSVSYGEYIPAVTLPSMMHFNDALKRETQDTMSPYHMSYSGAVPVIDIQQSYGYDDPTTPPLSTSWDHSGSESGYHYPTTPLSMPASPQMVQI